jgi:hypothetical protein
MATRLHITLCTLALLLTCSPALADADEWQKELGPTTPGNYAPLPPGKLDFELSWKGMLNSGKVGFDIGRSGAHKPGVFVIQSTGQSMGPGGAVFPYRGNCWSEINTHSLRPRVLTATETKRGEQIETKNRFFSNRVAFQETTTEKKKQRVESHVFAQNPVYDIGSAILFIRSQKLDEGDEINLMLHPYSSPYLLKSKVLGKEKLDGSDCIKLSLVLFKIDPQTFKLKAYKKMKEPALLWFSDDHLRLPVEIRSKVFIGDVRATLKAYKKA